MTKNVVYAAIRVDTIEYGSFTEKLFNNRTDALKYIRSLGYTKIRDKMHYHTSFDEMGWDAYIVKEWEVN